MVYHGLWKAAVMKYLCHSSHYVFTLYDYDSNVTLAEPIKSRRADHLVQGYDACYKRLTDAGIKPVLHRLDNEVSHTLLASIEAKKLKHQLVNTHMHRQNLAERAIPRHTSHQS